MSTSRTSNFRRTPSLPSWPGPGLSAVAGERPRFPSISTSLRSHEAEVGENADKPLTSAVPRTVPLCRATCRGVLGEWPACWQRSRGPSIASALGSSTRGREREALRGRPGNGAPRPAVTLSAATSPARQLLGKGWEMSPCCFFRKKRGPMQVTAGQSLSHQQTQSAPPTPPNSKAEKVCNDASGRGCLLHPRLVCDFQGTKRYRVMLCQNDPKCHKLNMGTATLRKERIDRSST